MRTSIDRIVERLSVLSRTHYYNPYTHFDWPAEVSRGVYWMEPQFLTVHGTDADLDETALVRLSHAETINFFSLHVHGIRELMGEVAVRIHTPRFKQVSEYLHHFLGEENDHMWFFAEFCNRYWDGVYPAADAVRLTAVESTPASWEDFLVFSRILIFEELFDYYNSRMGRSTSLPQIVRDLHAAHHRDESRHVAFGKHLVARLYEEAVSADSDAKDAVGQYIRNYIRHSIASMYNPRCYEHAGAANSLRARRLTMNHPARQSVHHQVMHRLDKFYIELGLYDVPWDAKW